MEIPEGRPLIVGVAHDGEEELRRLFGLVRQVKPEGGLGLELSENWREAGRVGLGESYFYQVADLFREVFPIVPLEDPGLREETSYVCIAKSVVDGIVSKEKIETKVREMDETYSPYMSPQQQAEFLPLARAKKALRLLARADAAEVGRIWDDLNRRREEYMAAVALERRPEMIVVGDAHTPALRGMLPDYSYVRLCKP